MIRLIFVVIFLLLYFILGLPVLGVLWLVGKWNKPAADIESQTDIFFPSAKNFTRIKNSHDNRPWISFFS